jgi:hypothetical protein
MAQVDFKTGCELILGTQEVVLNVPLKNFWLFRRLVLRRLLSLEFFLGSRDDPAVGI